MILSAVWRPAYGLNIIKLQDAVVVMCAGKSTLLQILAGQYMVGPDAVRILGRPAFHDIQLTSSGQLSYLGQQWRRDIAFAGYNVPIQVHITSLGGDLSKNLTTIYSWQCIGSIR